MFNFNVNFQDMFAKIQERRSKLISSGSFRAYSPTQKDLSSTIKSSVKDYLADVKKATTKKFETVFTETPDVSPKVEDETPVFEEAMANYGIVCTPKDKTPVLEDIPIFDDVMMNYGIVCTEDTIEIPEDTAETPIFDRVCANYGIVCYDDTEVNPEPTQLSDKLEARVCANYGIICPFDTNID